MITTDTSCPRCTRYRNTALPGKPFVGRTPRLYVVASGNPLWPDQRNENRCEACLGLTDMPGPPALTSLWGLVTLCADWQP